MSKSQLPRPSGYSQDPPWQDVSHLNAPQAVPTNTYPLDGAARICSTLFSELRNAIFASVAQRAIRQVARSTFGHLLSMDMGFHLTRQTGGLMRAIDRGTK